MAKAVLVHPGFVLAPAKEADGAVGQVLEAELDIGTERPFVEGRERCLGGVVRVSLFSRGEHLPALSGAFGERLSELRGRNLVGGEHDRLEAVKLRESAWTRLLGEQQGGATAGMSYADGTVQLEGVDDGEDVVGETEPVEVQPWRDS